MGLQCLRPGAPSGITEMFVIDPKEGAGCGVKRNWKLGIWLSTGADQKLGKKVLEGNCPLDHLTWMKLWPALGRSVKKDTWWMSFHTSVNPSQASLPQCSEAAQSWLCASMNRDVGFGHFKYLWFWCPGPCCDSPLPWWCHRRQLVCPKKVFTQLLLWASLFPLPCHVPLLLYPLSPVWWLSCGFPYSWCPDPQKLCHGQLGQQSNGIFSWNFSMWMLVVHADSCSLVCCTPCLLWSSVHLVLQDDLLGKLGTPLLKQQIFVCIILNGFT